MQSSTALSSSGESFPSTVGQARIAIALVALGGLIVTFLMSTIGCSADGSFDLSFVGADPSRYCELTRFPGVPDTVGALALVLGLSLAPAALASLGLFALSRTGRIAWFHVALSMAAVALFALFVLTATVANVEYQGGP
jgi:hypothetical protein